MDVALREVVAAFRRGEGELLSDTRRALVRRLEHAGLGEVVVKEIRPRRGLRGARERLRRLVGDTRGRRAEEAARRLRSLGLPVAEPLGRLEDQGRTVLVTRWLPGTPLSSVSSGRRAELAEALGDLVGRLHASGNTHGDLKPENLLVDESGRLALIDLDRAKVGVPPLAVAARARDLRPLVRAGLLDPLGAGSAWQAYGAAVGDPSPSVQEALVRWLGSLPDGASESLGNQGGAASV